jgi:hypothetical protein
VISRLQNVDTAKLWVNFSWGLLVFCMIGWPISTFTFASDEPQAILGLSWGHWVTW